MATEFVPVSFTKGAEVQVAYSLAEYMNLLWDGWLPGAPVAISPEQVRAYLSDLQALEAQLEADLESFAASLSAIYAAQTGGLRAVTGPTLPTMPAGTKYVWTRTDPTTGEIVDFVTGAAS